MYYIPLVVSLMYILLVSELGSRHNTVLVEGSTSFFTSTKRSYDEIPNPMVDPMKCGREGVPKSAICDPDHKIPKDKQDEIEGYINALTNAEVAVVVIDQINLKGLSARNIDEASEQFAIKLHNKWGVGDKVTNNGILLFLSISDRVVYISTGDGVKTSLDAAMIQGIIQGMRSDLRRSDYGSAIAKSIIEMDLVLNGKDNSKITAAYGADKIKIPRPHSSSSSSHESTESTGEFIFGMIFFGVFIGIGVLLKWRERWRLRGFERGTSALTRLMTEVDKAEDNKFHSTSCPICLEDFPKSELPALRRNQQNQNPEAMDSSSNGGDEVTSDSFKVNTNTANSQVDDKKKVMALRCGHAFCMGCLEDYLKTTDATKCPICRQPVEDGDHRHSPLANSQSRRANTSRQSLFNFGSSSANSAASYDYQPVPTQDYGSTQPSSRMQENANTATGTATYTETRQEADPNQPNYHHQDPFYSSNSFFTRRTPEYRFRLHRMRYLYPDVMTVELLRTMNLALDRGSMTDFRNHVVTRSTEIQKIVSDIREAAKNSARSSGSRGSSRSSFGGGSSRGGGGGRW